MKKKNTKKNIVEVNIWIIIAILVIIAAIFALNDFADGKEKESLQEEIDASLSDMANQIYEAASQCQAIQIEGEQGRIVLLEVRCYELLQQEQEGEE